MNKELTEHQGIKIYFDKGMDLFNCKIADIKIEETNLKVLKIKIEETLERITPINIKCFKYHGWVSEEITPVTIVRVNMSNKGACDDSGDWQDFKDLYEFSDSNKKLKKGFEERKAEGCRILKEAEEIGISMTKQKFFGEEEMKDEKIIEQNIKQKIGDWLAGIREERLKEHIIMLDWVLNDGLIREIDDIIKDEVYLK